MNNVVATKYLIVIIILVPLHKFHPIKPNAVSLPGVGKTFSIGWPYFSMTPLNISEKIKKIFYLSDMGKEKVIVLPNGAWLKKQTAIDMGVIKPNQERLPRKLKKRLKKSSEIWLMHYIQALYSRPTLVTEKFMQPYCVFDVNELDFNRVKNPYKL